MNIKFCSLSSGSSGNCQYIETKDSRILIDAGFSGKKIEGLLSSIGIDPTTLNAIFLTHEHSDHIKGAGVFSRRYDLPIYANEKTWLAMEEKIGKIKDKNIKLFKNNKNISFRDMDIEAFDIFHDAADPVGYLVNYSGKKISIVTDTGYIDNNIKDKILNSNLYLLESNHDVDMLRMGRYPYFLKERIKGKDGHLSNDDAGETLSEILLGSKEIVLLGHLSSENNLPELAHLTVKNALENKGLDVEKDIKLALTFKDKATKMFTL